MEKTLHLLQPLADATALLQGDQECGVEVAPLERVCGNCVPPNLS